MSTNHRIHAATAPAHAPEQSIGRSTLYGAASGVAGGILFGLLLTAMIPGSMAGMGSIIAIQNTAGGWVYHLFNSAVIGGIFGLVLGSLPKSLASGAMWGAIYGLAWWVLGGLILMPLMMGFAGRVLYLSSTSLIGLTGHLLFGVVTGTGYFLLKQRFR